MKTPMQEFIEFLENKIDTCRSVYVFAKEQNNLDSMQISRIESSTFRTCLEQAKQLKEKEKQAIVDARITAPTLQFNDDTSYREEAEQYYKQTFEQK